MDVASFTPVVFKLQYNNEIIPWNFLSIDAVPGEIRVLSHDPMYSLELELENASPYNFSILHSFYHHEGGNITCSSKSGVAATAAFITMRCLRWMIL